MTILTVLLGIGAAVGFMAYMIQDTGVPVIDGFMPTEVLLFVFVGSLGCTMARNSIGDFFRMILSLGKYFYYSQLKQWMLQQRFRQV